MSFEQQSPTGSGGEEGVSTQEGVTMVGETCTMQGRAGKPVLWSPGHGVLSLCTPCVIVDREQLPARSLQGLLVPRAHTQHTQPSTEGTGEEQQHSSAVTGAQR